MAIFGREGFQSLVLASKGLWSWVGVVARRAYLIPNFLIMKVGGVIIIVVMDQFSQNIGKGPESQHVKNVGIEGFIILMHTASQAPAQ